MEEKVVKIIIESFIKELVNQSKTIFTVLHTEGKQFLGTALKKYLEKHRDKFSKIKTLLKGNTPVFLYDIYYPLKLRNEERQNINTSNIKYLFEKGNYVTIIGDAGSGKSTLIKHLFLNSIEEQFAIPVLVELRYLNGTNGNIEEYICQQIFENKLSLNAKILERLFEKGKFVFFLDGFDELNSNVRNLLIKSLNDFMNLYDENKFIVTSRPYSNIESLSIFRNLEVQKLGSADIQGFIELQLKGERELAEKIKGSLKESKSSYIQSFLANPLLLSLYILTFQTYAEIPDKKYIFYRRVINALFSEHDSKTKLGFVREKKSQLNQEQFEEILKAFSLLSYFDQHFFFDIDYVNSTLKQVKQRIKSLTFDNSKFIDDLKSAIALWIEDNGRYSFAHRSLQEYFAAAFIKNLNPEQNLRAYSMIIEKFTENKQPLAEYKNFLSLCEEMDDINFYNYYYIPLLKELRGMLDNSSRENLVKSFVSFFTSGFVCYRESSETKIYHQISINPLVYKTIYLHLDYTQKLYHLLLKIGDKLVIDKEPKVLELPPTIQTSDTLDRRSGVIKKGLNVELKELYPYCLDSEFSDLAQSFLLYIENEINEKDEFIKQSHKTDKDLLDLIT